MTCFYRSKSVGEIRKGWVRGVGCSVGTRRGQTKQGKDGNEIGGRKESR